MSSWVHGSGVGAQEFLPPIEAMTLNLAQCFQHGQRSHRCQVVVDSFASLDIPLQETNAGAAAPKEYGPNNQRLDCGRGLLGHWRAGGSHSHFFVFNSLISKIHDHGMKVKFEPAPKCWRIARSRPSRLYPIPSV